MWLEEIARRWSGRGADGRPGPRRPLLRPALEPLEDRTVPASYTAATVPELTAAIRAANLEGGSNTIALAAGRTFTLTAADNDSQGPTGLPAVAANNSLTVVGVGGTIERSPAAGTPEFRLMYV